MRGLEEEKNAEKQFADKLEDLEKDAAARLGDEKAKTQAALKRAEEAVKLFEKAQREIEIADERRRAEIAALRDKMLTQEKELLQTQNNQEKLLAEINEKHQADLRHWRYIVLYSTSKLIEIHFTFFFSS